MRRATWALALSVVGFHHAHAAECTVHVQKRWENAMREIVEIERIPWRQRLDEKNVPLQCRIWAGLVEVSAAAKDYFPACDPIHAPYGHVAVQRSETALAQFDASKCAKATASAGKKK